MLLKCVGYPDSDLGVAFFGSSLSVKYCGVLLEHSAQIAGVEYISLLTPSLGPALKLCQS